MSIDLFQPRVMRAAVREMKQARSFLRDTFFANQRFYRTENIDVDVQVKGRRVAPFVNKLAPGKLVERLGFTSSSVAPPCVAMKMPITVQDVSTRSMGENIYEDRDPAQRGRDLLADDLVELEQMLTRREEMMCRDAIWTLSGNSSLVTAAGDDSTLSFSFARLSGLQIGTLGGSDAWTHADSDPLAKIDEWMELYAKLTGYVADRIVFGGTAYRTALANAKFKASLVNTSLIQSGTIAANAPPDGARQVGQLYGGSVSLWTYHEWYDDPDNAATTTEMVPAKKVMIASSRLETEMRYGANQDLTSRDDNGMPTLVTGRVLPRSWTTQDPPVRYVELRSRPLPVPIQNHFLTAQVQA